MPNTIVSLVKRFRSSAVLLMVIACFSAEYFDPSYLCKHLQLSCFHKPTAEE